MLQVLATVDPLLYALYTEMSSSLYWEDRDYQGTSAQCHNSTPIKQNKIAFELRTSFVNLIFAPDILRCLSRPLR